MRKRNWERGNDELGKKAKEERLKEKLRNKEEAKEKGEWNKGR